MLPYTDDSQLLADFQEGNPPAEKAVFDRFFQPLCLYAHRLTNDLPLAEDIAVEAFEKLLHRRMDFASLARLRSFLYQTVHNASIDQLRSRKRHREIHETMLANAGPESELPVSEQDALWGELIQEIYAEVEQLPDRCGQIFKMIYLADLSTDEIARQLNINPQTVRTQKARAIQLIRTSLLKKNRILTVFVLAELTRLYAHR